MMDRSRRFLKHLEREKIPRSSDVQYRRAVRAKGIGFMEVVADGAGNRKGYTVAVPGTKAPGAKITTARHVGTQGEIGILTAPLGQRGSAAAIVSGSVIPSGDVNPGGCVFNGATNFENLNILNGDGITSDADSIICLVSGSFPKRFSVEVAPSGCWPTDVSAFAEQQDGGQFTFGSQHPWWSVSQSGVLSNGNLHLVLSLAGVINPTPDTFDGVIRIWGPITGHLTPGSWSAFAALNLIQLSGPTRATVEI
jgi:hypothetical protein